MIYGADELAMAQPIAEPNSLFMDGEIAPPVQTSSSSWSGSEAEGLVNGNGVPVIFTCMCGHSPC